MHISSKLPIQNMWPQYPMCRVVVKGPLTVRRALETHILATYRRYLPVTHGADTTEYRFYPKDTYFNRQDWMNIVSQADAATAITCYWASELSMEYGWWMIEGGQYQSHSCDPDTEGIGNGYAAFVQAQGLY